MEAALTVRDELKDRRKAPRKTAEDHARELADALLVYQDTRKEWKQQEVAWSQIKKTLPKYRLAKAREEKQQKERLL